MAKILLGLFGKNVKGNKENLFSVLETGPVLTILPQHEWFYIPTEQRPALPVSRLENQGTTPLPSLLTSVPQYPVGWPMLLSLNPLKIDGKLSSAEKRFLNIH